MTSLGSVLEPSSGGGIDLVAEVVVAPSQLGTGAPVMVGLPEELADAEGGKHARVPSPHDRTGTISLGLPAELRDGTVLRLRGQGGRESDGGPAGDLYLTIRVDPRATAMVASSKATVPTALVIVLGLLAWAAAFVVCA